jgi:hypothetical protein
LVWSTSKFRLISLKLNTVATTFALKIAFPLKSKNWLTLIKYYQKKKELE